MDEGLRRQDDCPYCHIKVAFHSRDVSLSQASSSSSSSSSPAVTPPSTTLNKSVIASLPKWGVDFKVCSPFFRKLEQLFNIYGVSNTDVWCKYLVLTLSDPEDSNWAFTNLVSSNIDWNTVKQRFTSSFERYDHVAKLSRDYDTIEYDYKRKESIQKFSHRFINLCSELGYDVTGSNIRDHFLLRIPKPMLQHFQVLCHSRNTPMSSLTLTQIIDLLIQLDVVYNGTNNPSTSSTSSSSSSTSTSSASTLSCRYHPNSTSHTTQNCRLNNSNNNNNNNNIKKSPSSSPSVSLNSQVSNMSWLW